MYQIEDLKSIRQVLIMIQAHQNSNQITTNDTRQRIISAVLDGADLKLVSRIFNVKLWTVRRIMKKYYATGETDKEKQGVYKPKLMNEDATVSLSNMQLQLESVDGLRVALLQSTIQSVASTTVLIFEILFLLIGLSRRIILLHNSSYCPEFDIEGAGNKFKVRSVQHGTDNALKCVIGGDLIAILMGLDHD